MNISELSTTESRQLLLIHTKLNYDNADSVNKVIKLIKARGFFQTEAGQLYRNAIEGYALGKSPIDCIYCRAGLDYGEYLICRKCNQDLFDRVNQENKEIQKERAEVSAAQTAAIKIAQNLHNPENAEQEEMLEYARERLEIIAADAMKQEPPKPDLFSQGATTYGNMPYGNMSYGNMSYGSMPYENMPYGNMPEFMYGNVSSGDSQELAQGSGRAPEKSKSKISVNKLRGQKMIVAAISVLLIALMAVLVALRVTDSGKEKISADKSNGALKALDSAETSEIIDETPEGSGYDISANEPNTEDLTADTKPDYVLRDGYELLGMKYTEVDNDYGEYEEYLADNARYYPECGVSLVFDSDTKRILYIENDGSGSSINVVPILGIAPGDSTVKMIKTLADNGLEPSNITEDNFICQFGSYENPDITYELSVNSNEGIINLISVRVIK